MPFSLAARLDPLVSRVVHLPSPALPFLSLPVNGVAPMESHRRPFGRCRTRPASLPFMPQPPTYKGRASPLPFSILARYREPPPPVKTPLPSANADAKATRSTAGPPRARRYSPFRVLALFCPATPSPARLFSLQSPAVVDIASGARPERRERPHPTHGELATLPVPSIPGFTPWSTVPVIPVHAGHGAAVGSNPSQPSAFCRKAPAFSRNQPTVQSSSN